jgi:hypothetical protein
VSLAAVQVPVVFLIAVAFQIALVLVAGCAILKEFDRGFERY